MWTDGIFYSSVLNNINRAEANVAGKGSCYIDWFQLTGFYMMATLAFNEFMLCTEKRKVVMMQIYKDEAAAKIET